ncbi:MAG: hypothetical protein EPO61_04900 [Nitrospirae bacterium]|nr:MAG: hypothetical protein EPO61_04900 [Nitrospirota bacterium]
MTKQLGLALMTVCAVSFWGGVAALAGDGTPAQPPNDSSSVLKEQQDVESRLAESQAKRQELERERKRILNEAGRNSEERASYSKACETGGYASGEGYSYTSPAQCAFDKAQISSGGAEVNRQLNEVNRRLEGLNSEANQLAGQREQLKRQAESLKFKSEVPTLQSIGPIEQMGIEDEQRRRRKARQKELSGE